MERLTVYPAKIVEGVVQINQGNGFLPASDALKLSQGEADSQGYVVIGEALALYFVNTQPDLQAQINKLVELCGELIKVCDTSDWLIAATGGVAGLSVNLQSIKPAFEQLKSDFEQYKLK